MNAGTVEYLVILSVFMPKTGEYATMTRTPSFDANATRGQVYAWAIAELPERLRKAVVLFFSAEPNTAPHAASAAGATVNGAPAVPFGGAQ